MKILVINYEYPPIGGGGGFVTRDIAEEIAAKGHSVTVITSHYGELAKQDIVNGVNIIRVPVIFRTKIEVANLVSMLYFLPSGTISGLLRCKRRSFDIINTHFAIPSGPVGYVLSKALHIPNVLSIHGGDLFDPSRFISPHKTPIISNVVSRMLKTAHRVIAQSTDTKRNAYKYYQIKRPVEVIPLGIKRPVFKHKGRSDFDLKDDEIVFCTIGRLVKRKNIGEMFGILSRLKSDFEFKLLIIGDGPERNYLEKLAFQKGLIGNIRFLGTVSDEIKFQVLDISDFYLSTALHEGFGLVFLEAMACGLPIVCYDQGGQKDFLVSGKTGFLVEFGNKMDFRHRIIELINHSKLRSKISEYNHFLINKYYISTCAERYISHFSDVISEYSRAWERMN